MSATNGWNCGFNSLQFHFGPHGKSSGHPTPGVFAKSLELLENKRVDFLRYAKSAEEYESKGNDRFALGGNADPSQPLGARECERKRDRSKQVGTSER